MTESSWIDEYLARSQEPKGRPQTERITGSIPVLRRRHVYFLSYSRSDREVADHVEVLLRRLSREVWRDEEGVSASQRIDDKVKRGIDQAHTFVALWSDAYKESEDWCMAELRRALQQTGKKGEAAGLPRGEPQRRVVVLRIEDTEPYWRMENKLHLDGTTRAERELAIKKLVDAEGAGPNSAE